MDLKFYRRDAAFEDRKLNATIVKLENAVIALFWEGEKPRLGTLTVTLPNRTSSTLLGDRDGQLGLLLGSHIAAITGKMALVSTNLKVSTGNVAGKVLLNLAREIAELEEKEGAR